MLHLLKSAESNAELNGLDADSLVIEHIQVSKAPKMEAELKELMNGVTHISVLPAIL